MRKLVVVIIGILVLSGVILYLSPRDKSTTTFDSPTSQTTTATPPVSVYARLSAADYRRISTSLQSVTNDSNPREAIARLKEQMLAEPLVFRSCHSFAHEIGRAAYLKYQDVGVALTYQDDFCGAGYLHGVIETYLGNSLEDPTNQLKTLCESYDTARVADKCYHGMGHGLMLYTKNNLPTALADCSSQLSGVPAVRCEEGVFMENFESDESFHPTLYLKADDLFFPCAVMAQDYQQTCYFYAPIHYLLVHPGDYDGLLRWCNEAGGNDWVCVDGAGSRIMKENLLTPTAVENYCKSAKKSLQSACLDGAVSYFLVDSDSLAKTKDYCKTLSSEGQSICLKAVANRASYFPD